MTTTNRLVASLLAETTEAASAPVSTGTDDRVFLSSLDRTDERTDAAVETVAILLRNKMRQTFAAMVGTDPESLSPAIRKVFSSAPVDLSRVTLKKTDGKVRVNYSVPVPVDGQKRPSYLNLGVRLSGTVADILRPVAQTVARDAD